MKKYPKQARSHVGICFQDDVLFDVLTVEEHIRFYAQVNSNLKNEFFFVKKVGDENLTLSSADNRVQLSPFTFLYDLWFKIDTTYSKVNLLYTAFYWALSISEVYDD